MIEAKQQEDCISHSLKCSPKIGGRSMLLSTCTEAIIHGCATGTKVENEKQKWPLA